MSQSIDRRDLLRYGALGAAGLGLQGILARTAMAVAQDSDVPLRRKMIVVFLRGGNDAANMVVPQTWDAQGSAYLGDTTYSTTCRPTLWLESDPGATATPTLDLGNRFASLHPSFAALKTAVQNEHVVFLHRIGMQNRSGSHFTDQQGWETANPGVLSFEEGWITRMVPSITSSSNLLKAASISSRQQRLFLSNDPNRALPVVPRITEYFNNNKEYTLQDGLAAPRNQIDDKLIGSATAHGGLGDGLRGHYQNTGLASMPLSPLVRATGELTLDSESVISGLGTYMPAMGATYPTSTAGLTAAGLPDTFSTKVAMRNAQDAIQLIKETDCRVAGFQLGGWDTHNKQGTLTGRQPDLLKVLAHIMNSLYVDLLADDALFEETIVTVISEFGRTSAENGTQGTDHGDAGAVIVMGGGVQMNRKPGVVVPGKPVYNCDSTTWVNGDMFSSGTNPPPCAAPFTGRYIAYNTEFRAVYAEIIEQHFGLSPIETNRILPGWAPTGADPRENQIGFL
ncbi:MAG: DUF1501 domain-containing protein [Planctomycetota bacterium]